MDFRNGVRRTLDFGVQDGFQEWSKWTSEPSVIRHTTYVIAADKKDSKHPGIRLQPCPEDLSVAQTYVIAGSVAQTHGIAGSVAQTHGIAGSVAQTHVIAGSVAQTHGIAGSVAQTMSLLLIRFQASWHPGDGRPQPCLEELNLAGRPSHPSMICRTNDDISLLIRSSPS
jgi:hypothetical protein